MPALLFAPFSSAVESGCWHALSKIKLEVQKLEETPLPARATYTRGQTVFDRSTGQEVALPCTASLDAASLDPEGSTQTASQPEAVELRGQLINFNTVESLRASDKAALFQAVVDVLWNRIQSQDELDAASLNPFLLLTFADLKKYKFYYWFAFPALIAEPAWEAVADPRPLSDSLTEEEFASLARAFSTAARTQPEHLGACLARRSIQDNSIFETAPLHMYGAFFTDVPEDHRLMVLLDPSSHPTAAGWPLRNILAYLQAREKLTAITVVLWRDSTVNETDYRNSKSRIVSVRADLPQPLMKPSASGWEKNAQGNLGPRLADLGPIMDPRQLADSAIDLNLKLMRWRVLPALNLERIQSTRCLLLGAGTLGCYVARALLAWGVRMITLVDSGRVSFSNPVRQPLFEFDDCLEGGKPKAECAAAALQRIYPGVEARGVLMNIPMPGHPIPPTQVDMARADVTTLEQLIDAHDVVYLLMDSRESRWLPTLLGAAKDKLVINAALGFDSYLVMRHGSTALQSSASEGAQPGQPYRGRLGCYFCNDIVAPTDSLTDRTLDQMCTVTRPGLAAIAGASAVELTVSVLQHPSGIRAHADTESVLGGVPHQLRGYLTQFETLKIVGQAYDRCTACSDRILARYRTESFDFLLKAFDDAKTLEQATGLDELQHASEAMEDLDWADDDDDALNED